MFPEKKSRETSGLETLAAVFLLGTSEITGKIVDQESTNGSPCLVEWKSRNITIHIGLWERGGVTVAMNVVTS